jgi:hypothetical protein
MRCLDRPCPGLEECAANKLKQREAYGWSPWLGYLKRSLIENGKLHTSVSAMGWTASLRTDRYLILTRKLCALMGQRQLRWHAGLAAPNLASAGGRRRFGAAELLVRLRLEPALAHDLVSSVGLRLDEEGNDLGMSCPDFSFDGDHLVFNLWRPQIVGELKAQRRDDLVWGKLYRQQPVCS